MKRRVARQSGFVLLLTLILVLLAGVTLAGLARRSLEQAVEAKAAEQSLKRRWAVKTMRSTLLDRAPRILERAERGQANDQPTRASDPPPQVGRGGERWRDRESNERSDFTAGAGHENDPIARLPIACTLAGIDYLLVITDEQAKLNANHFLANRTRGEAQGELENFVSAVAPATGRRLRPQLQPLTTTDSDNKGSDASLNHIQRLNSFGQLFTSPTATQLLGSDRSPGPARFVTCWGSGKVNVHRASEAVIKRACQDRVDQRIVRRLLEQRRKQPHQPLPSMLMRINEVDRKAKANAMNHLTDQSNCFGLWIIARSRSRTWHTFAVDPPGRPTQRFAW